MTYADALARASRWREALLDHGVARVSIELQRGRPGTPNDGWWDDRFVGSLLHHIVSRRSQGDTPGLDLVKRGRPDLPGPLANGYGGFDEIARIITLGWANHPGEGGPLWTPSGTIPADNGRPYLAGWEFEGGLDPDDWPDSFHAFMARCSAGTLDWIGTDVRAQGEHKTWAPARKVDRLGYTTTSGRAATSDHWDDGAPAPPPPPPLPEETDMPTAQIVTIPPAEYETVTDDAGVESEQLVVDDKGWPTNAVAVALPPAAGSGGVKFGRVFVSLAVDARTDDPVSVWAQQWAGDGVPRPLYGDDRGWRIDTDQRTRNDTSAQIGGGIQGVTFAHSAKVPATVLVEIDQP